MPRQGIIALGEFVYAYLVTEVGLAEYEASTIHEREVRALQRLLNLRIRSGVERQVPFYFQWVDTLQSAVSFSGTESDFAMRASLISTLATLTWRQLEHLCGVLLQAYGASADTTLVTRGQGDEGIDFYGVLPAKPAAGLGRPQATSWRILGQATLGEPSISKVSGFCWRVTQVRSGGGSFWEAMEPWFRDAQKAPIMGLFVTLGHFGRTAERDSQQAVVMLLERDQVAEDLASSPLSLGWRDEQGAFVPDRLLRLLPND